MDEDVNWYGGRFRPKPYCGVVLHENVEITKKNSFCGTCIYLPNAVSIQMVIFVRFLPVLAKIWLPWQRRLDPCNQKYLHFVVQVVLHDVIGKGATTGGAPPPKKKNWTDHPNFLMKSVITVT